MSTPLSAGELAEIRARLKEAELMIMRKLLEPMSDGGERLWKLIQDQARLLDTVDAQAARIAALDAIIAHLSQDLHSWTQRTPGGSRDEGAANG